MKREGHSFDHWTLEAIRLMAVERVRDGERPPSVIASLDFNRTTIYKWLTAASQTGEGQRALRSPPVWSGFQIMEAVDIRLGMIAA